MHRSLLLGVVAAAQCAAAPPASPVAGQIAAPLELLVLGSGGPAALGRAASSYVLLLAGKPRVLVDAGPGAFARAGEARLSLDSLDIVLLTHLHVDHAAELPGFVKARAVAATAAIQFEVYGPQGQAAHADLAEFPATSRFIALLFDAGGVFPYLRNFSAPVSFKVTDLPASGPQSKALRTILAREDLKIQAIGGHHGDAPAVIYRVDYRGRSVVFSGDIDAAGLPALEAIAQGADLLVFDAVVLDPPDSPAVLYTLHSPPSAIGALAARSHVRTLLLSHLSPAVDGARRAVSGSIASRYGGTVSFAADGERVQP